ncbi:MAG: GrdX family protein [Tissierellaceae bacterium]|jgi:hypothetical protein|nr:GrdX protein [Tissierellia bacterium]
MRAILITNNVKVYDKFKDNMDIVYRGECSYLEVLELARDKIYQGHELLTHPLSGSLKPNETPFKSIIISKERSSLDHNSLNIIEASIETTKKFLRQKTTPMWTERVLEDFRIIDLSLIENILDSP